MISLALSEALQDPKVSKILENTKASKEILVLQMFFTILQNDPSRAYYGYTHVALVFF